MILSILSVKNKITVILVLFTLLSCLNSCYASQTQNYTVQDIINTGGTILLPYSSSNWSPVLPISSGSVLGYYINPQATPISEVDFNALKHAGVTDVYVLVTDDNYKSVLPETKLKADAVGIRTNAWVFPGFSYPSEVAGMGIGVLLDVETYDMPAYISQIKAMRSATQGVTFSLCVKPDCWDDNQYYYLIAPLCDHIVPMLYIGDYNQGLTGLTNWVKLYNIYNLIYPGKIIAGLETYQSDQNLTPKDVSDIKAEIKSVEPYTGGVILFRYGLSNYRG